jgi:hypothetical protein
MLKYYQENVYMCTFVYNAFVYIRTELLEIPLLFPKINKKYFKKSVQNSWYTIKQKIQ